MLAEPRADRLSLHHVRIGETLPQDLSVAETVRRQLTRPFARARAAEETLIIDDIHAYDSSPLTP
jgi:hypothetical protein